MKKKSFVKFILCVLSIFLVTLNFVDAKAISNKEIETRGSIETYKVSRDVTMVIDTGESLGYATCTATIEHNSVGNKFRLIDSDVQVHFNPSKVTLMFLGYTTNPKLSAVVVNDKVDFTLEVGQFGYTHRWYFTKSVPI